MDPHGGDLPHPDPNSGLEEPMWRLGLGGGGGGGAGYPERPGERDCAYYLRTGTCGYGDRCRYNHPIDRGKTVVGAGRIGGGEFPERYGQALCEHYLKTGTCRFGSSCKYHHPRQGDGSVQPVPLNVYGYPLRPGEEECSYFMKTGRCKYGLTCKFHHPLPPTSSLPSNAPAFYPAPVAAPQQYPEMGGWQFGGSSSALSGAYMPNSYGPIMIPPGVIPLPSWNPYLASLGEAVSSGPPSQSSSSFAPAYPGLYHPVISPSGPSSSAQKERYFPQRPGQHECHYYMKTGECKYGATCKYHHPLDWRLPATNYTLSPLGLPLRPGAQICPYYAQHGLCKFGPTCKFDHPIGPSIDMPAAPY